MNDLYEKDFYRWTQEQSMCLMSNNFKDLDIANLIEEIDCLGRREKSELVNRLVVLFSHILKWKYQPSLRSKGWMYTIEEQQERIEDLFLENPSLKHHSKEISEKAYRYALKEASKETGLNPETFPKYISFSLEDSLRFREE